MAAVIFYIVVTLYHLSLPQWDAFIPGQMATSLMIVYILIQYDLI